MPPLSTDARALAFAGILLAFVAKHASNLVCRALAMGLGSLDGLAIECRNRIPLGRGLGSSAAAVCSGLVAANALGRLGVTELDQRSVETTLGTVLKYREDHHRIEQHGAANIVNQAVARSRQAS